MCVFVLGGLESVLKDMWICVKGIGKCVRRDWEYVKGFGDVLR